MKYHQGTLKRISVSEHPNKFKNNMTMKMATCKTCRIPNPSPALSTARKRRNAPQIEKKKTNFYETKPHPYRMSNN